MRLWPNYYSCDTLYNPYFMYMFLFYTDIRLKPRSCILVYCIQQKFYIENKMQIVSV